MRQEGLRVLAVDDVAHALDELCRLLRDLPEVGELVCANDALGALKMIRSGAFDAVFLDISMPGMDGLELASLLAQLQQPPVLVFVTAHDAHAVAAFDVGAVDYLLKPVRAERLSATLARVSKMVSSAETTEREVGQESMPAVPVETAGRTRYLRRSEVHYVEAHGDHVRLYTGSGAHVVRMPISRLAEYWDTVGFTRVHRSYLVALDSVRELRSDSTGGLVAHTAVGDVPVSRRHARDLRERLLQHAQGSELTRSPRSP